MSLSLGYMNRVVDKHKTKPSDLGSFKPPRLETVIAAETIVDMLHASYAYQGRMAVCVIELLNRSTSKTRFVASFSGYHPSLLIDKKEANAKLLAALSEHSRQPVADARFVIMNEMDKSYFPMHTESSSFLERNLRKNILSKPLSAAEFKEAISEFWDVFQGFPPGGRPSTSTFSFDFKSNTNVKNPIQKLCAAFVAVRMGIVVDADLKQIIPDALRLIKNLRNDVTGTQVHDLKVFARVLEACLHYDESVPQPTTVADKTLASAMKAIWTAAGSGPYGQYCAEPKAYFYARNAAISIGKEEQHGAVQGSLALWYSGTGLESFSKGLVVIGPDGNESEPKHGGYMKPCSSCKARSLEMMLSL